jgi:hypothetical protein
MVVHREPLNGLVVLNHRIEPLLLKFLPVLTQFVLIIVVEHKQKVLNIRNCLLKLEITLGRKQVISQFLKFSDTILSVL